MTIGIHCNTRQTREKRTWDKFPEFFDALVKRYKCTLLFTGSTDDLRYIYSMIGNVRSYARTEWIGCNFGELETALRSVDLFVTVNSFPMHLAAALDIPTLALIGGTPAVVVCRETDKFKFIEAKDLIVNNITVEEVMEKVNDQLR